MGRKQILHRPLNRCGQSFCLKYLFKRVISYSHLFDIKPTAQPNPMVSLKGTKVWKRPFMKKKTEDELISRPRLPLLWSHPTNSSLTRVEVFVVSSPVAFCLV